MLLPPRSEATAAHRAALVIVINNVWLIWLIKQSGNPLPVGNTTSSRITKITSELSAGVTPLSDKKLDSRSRSKNTFMQRSFERQISVTLKVLVCSLVTLNRRFSGRLCVAGIAHCKLQHTHAWFVPGQWPNASMFDAAVCYKKHSMWFPCCYDNFFPNCTSWVWRCCWWVILTWRDAISIYTILFYKIWKTAVSFRAKTACDKKVVRPISAASYTL